MRHSPLDTNPSVSVKRAIICRMDFCISWVPHSKFSLKSRGKKQFRHKQWIGQRSLCYRYTTVSFYMALESMAVIWPTKQKAKPNCHLYFVIPLSSSDFLNSSRSCANVPILLLSVSIGSSLKQSCQNCFDAPFSDICSVSPVVILTVGNQIKKTPYKHPSWLHLSGRTIVQRWELRFRVSSSRQFFNEDE